MSDPWDIATQNTQNNADDFVGVGVPSNPASTDNSAPTGIFNDGAVPDTPKDLVSFAKRLDRLSASSSSSESVPYYERAKPEESQEQEEAKPKIVAPKPKALDEDASPITPIPSRSLGRTVDQRMQPKPEPITTIGDMDPTTAYADKEEGEFIQGVIDKHGSVKS
ncbi:hypothetical protein KBG31_00415 [Patescibacteria group bacterium]|nr:hypothetical protein [Patescibacteria group bacterium]HOM77872.1 hypothetical protein [bacterium]